MYQHSHRDPDGRNMPATSSIDLACRAKLFYEQNLQAKLEATNRDDFVAVDPDSGEYFIEKTLSDAIQSARRVLPGSLPYVIRIGHKNTVELGVISP